MFFTFGQVSKISNKIGSLSTRTSCLYLISEIKQKETNILNTYLYNIFKVMGKDTDNNKYKLCFKLRFIAKYFEYF